MPKLFSSDPLPYRIILVVLLGLASPMLFAQAAPPAPPATTAPPATIAPTAAPTAVEPTAGAPGDPASATSSTASSGASSAASSSAKPPEKPIYLSSSERDNALLAQAEPDETLWLETPNEKIIALFKTGETRKTKGALLMLHAPETPQLWPAPLEHLRRNLPIYGWETMAVPLPQKYPSKTPEREIMSSSASPSSSSIASGSSSSSAADEAEAPSEESSPSSSEQSSSPAPSSSAASSSASSEPEKPRLPREQLIAERVDAAIKELNKVGEFNVVVLVDNSSAVDSLAALQQQVKVASSDKDTIDGPLQAIILVNLQSHEPLSKEQLASVFAVELIPVMDVFFAPEDQQQKDLRRLHRAEAMRKNVRIYQQVVLPPENLITVNDRQGFWLEKVRGFMETKAEGKELKLKKSAGE